MEGTFGYMAPEYFMHGELNEKTDVYAFGIVLLEIITGRRPIEASRPQLEQNLHSWVSEVFSVNLICKFFALTSSVSMFRI